ncbi:metallophosphoesterase family protein [Geodermatophilus sp. SYSU D00691]
MTRLQPVPAYLEQAVNLHLVSDVHCQTTGVAMARAAKVVDDVQRMVGRAAINARLVLGDLTQDALDLEAALWQTWRADLEGDVHAVLGNHDFTDTDPARSPDAMAVKLGLPAKNYMVDVGDVRVLCIGPSSQPDGRLTLGPADLGWLDGVLAVTTRPCLIAFHAPLWETVGGPPGWHSGEPTIHAWPHPEIRQLLSGHPNAIAWLSGHTHAPIETPGAITSVDVGHSLAAVNCTGLWYTSPDHTEAHDPLRGLLLSVLDEHTLEVRFRDHGAGVWTTPVGGEHGGRKVVRLAV